MGQRIPNTAQLTPTDLSCILSFSSSFNFDICMVGERGGWNVKQVDPGPALLRWESIPNQLHGQEVYRNKWMDYRRTTPSTV